MWWRVGLYAGFCSVACAAAVAIPLGRRLPDGSSGQPGSDQAGSPLPARPCSGWGLPSRSGHPERWCALTAPFHPYLCDTTPKRGLAIGGLLSVALSCESPRLGVTQHPALRSPDVPRTDRVRTRPPSQLATRCIVAHGRNRLSRRRPRARCRARGSRRAGAGVPSAGCGSR
jgi:hypothetical protein